MTIWVVTIFFVQFCVFLPPLLNIFCFFKSIPLLSFIEPIFPWNAPLVSLMFLKRSIVFPILLFSFISLHWSLKKAFLSLLSILWNYASKWVYLSFSALPFMPLLFIAICKASSNNYFTLLFLGYGLDHCLLYNVMNLHPYSSCTLSDLIPWVCLPLPLYNCKWFDLGHTQMV